MENFWNTDAEELRPGRQKSKEEMSVNLVFSIFYLVFQYLISRILYRNGELNFRGNNRKRTASDAQLFMFRSEFIT